MRNISLVTPLFILSLSIFALAIPAAAFAQTPPGINAEAQTVMDYNHIHPMQNPEYEKAEDTMNRHIVDNKNRVVGDLQDILVGHNGTVHSLKVSFTRLNLDSSVYLNYAQLRVQPMSKAYMLGFTDDQLAQIYPNLLAQIDTAAGPGASDDISLQKLQGAEIMADDGRHLGTVQDVLFNADGQRAAALYITLQTGVINGQQVAIPFSAAHFGDDSGRMTGLVSASMAGAMIDYVSRQ